MPKITSDGMDGMAKGQIWDDEEKEYEDEQVVSWGEWVAARMREIEEQWDEEYEFIE